ncbi:MAG: hypothetical protein OXG46_03725 [Chloroflexi bacterium]|nr:hypothetical protein [Chloroflexota bacterium]MCY3938731.1 hypothetical protein [Chloroflexota bacterium]
MPLVDVGLLPGLALFAVQVVAIAIFGYVIVRGLLGQQPGYLAAAQGLIAGLAFWGLLVNAAFYVAPGAIGVILAWSVAAMLTVVLIWKKRVEPRPTLSAAATFAAIFLPVFWIALSARQLLWVPDIGVHVPLTASMMAGNFPPAFPWNPNEPAFYHYGPDLIIGALEAGTGLGYVLVTELLGAFSVTALFLIVGSLVACNRSLWSLILTVPLMLSAGAWTLVVVGDQPWTLLAAAPAGLPQAGIRASLLDVYLPGAGVPWMAPVEASPPNIFNPAFSMSYALLLILVERLVAGGARPVVGLVATSMLGAYLILLDEPIFAAFALIWAIVVAFRFARVRESRISDLGVGTAGIAVSILLAVVYGGVLFDTVFRSAGGESGLAFVWPDLPSLTDLLVFDRLPGNLGILGIGPLVLVALVAFGWRAGLMSLLLAGAGLAMWTVGLFVEYEFSSFDNLRLQGHFRNLLLIATILVIGYFLARLKRWPFRIACAALAVIVVWPTVAGSGANLWFAAKNGPQIAIPTAETRRVHAGIMGRAELAGVPAELVSYIKDHLAGNASILSPNPMAISVASGRPSPYGYVDFTQYVGLRGPEYLDAIEHLDPDAVRRLGVGYVHATPMWVDGLPERSRDWLERPEYFKPLVQSETGALYQVLEPFSELVASPPPGSFTELRYLTGRGARIYIPPVVHPLDRLSMAAALQGALLYGDLGDPAHVRSTLGLYSYNDQDLDFLILPSRLSPTVIPAHLRSPVWSRAENTVYAVGDVEDGAIRRGIAALWIDIEESRVDQHSIRFGTRFEIGDSDGWTGQDWVLIADDGTRWAVPALQDRPVHWYSGQVDPSAHDLRVEYDLNLETGALQWSTGGSEFLPAQSSTSELIAGSYVLAVRLTLDGSERIVLPVLRVHVSPDGGFRFEFFEDPLAAGSIE